MFILPGHGVCIHVLLSMASPLQTFPGLHERVLVCKLLPHVAAQGPKAVHCVKFSSPFPCKALRAASMDALYSSSSRICSISKKTMTIFNSSIQFFNVLASRKKRNSLGTP